MEQRLQKILAQGTNLSRRAAEVAIKDGEVRVNGVVVSKLGSKADPEKDRIIYKGKQVRLIRQKIYIILNKPRNTIVSKTDEKGRPTIWDRLHADMREILNSAGRLDFDSEGLLILTNDGSFIHKITHPSSELWKTYYVKVSGIPKEEEIEKLRNGVKLDDGMTLPAKIEWVRSTDKNAVLEISIREGRNRQVRRMFAKIGHDVMKLRRIEIGEIKLGNLKPGEWRYLEKKELYYIKKVLAKVS